MKAKRGNNVGRFLVEFDVSNYQDEVAARLGALDPTQIRRARISGVVDSGASELVLPEKVAKELGVPKGERIKVRYADGRRATRDLVDDVRLKLHGTTRDVPSHRRTAKEERANWGHRAGSSGFPSGLQTAAACAPRPAFQTG
jgi:hypothetical protein